MTPRKLARHRCCYWFRAGPLLRLARPAAVQTFLHKVGRIPMLRCPKALKQQQMLCGCSTQPPAAWRTAQRC